MPACHVMVWQLAYASAAPASDSGATHTTALQHLHEEGVGIMVWRTDMGQGVTKPPQKPSKLSLIAGQAFQMGAFK
eukprot:scaffold115257_cov17-Tisochrysis_lutea.AAC.2